MADGGQYDELVQWLGEHAARPRAFVYGAFPWGEAGTELAERQGPEDWQDRVLLSIETKLLAGLASPAGIIAEAIQEAIKSGHDIGKSTLVSWLIIWAISTREDTKGVVTANTEKQLRLKLWPELAKWHRLFLARDLFKVTATSIQTTDPDRVLEWRIDAIPWSEDNPEAFAGLHNFGKRVIVIFDEASGIVDKIWETIDGVMNEAATELLWIATGNPTRNTGRFRECFDKSGQGQFWNTHTVDSREVSFTNKDRIQRQIDLWGEESDFIKVRWLGLFPESGNAQLIPSDVIETAMRCQAQSQHWEPLIMGVDVARFGDNESVIEFRRGRDARTIPAVRLRKLSTTDLGNHIVTRMALHSPDAVFIDVGGVGGGVIDFVRSLGYNVIAVEFGGSPGTPLAGERAANKRAEMYLSLRTWLSTGGAISNDPDLKKQLVAQEYYTVKAKKNYGAINLIAKEDMDESPDWSDALALTFAFPVSKAGARAGARMKTEYDPLALGVLPGEARDTPRPSPWLAGSLRVN